MSGVDKFHNDKLKTDFVLTFLKKLCDVANIDVVKKQCVT